MKQHFCYYCNREIVKDIVLVTFYTKDCSHCGVTYHLDFNHQITLIVLEATIRDNDYVITHNPSRKKTRVAQRRKEWVWHTTPGGGASAEVLPIEVAEFDGDHNTLNPTNLEERLRTILTFL